MTNLLFTLTYVLAAIGFYSSAPEDLRQNNEHVIASIFWPLSIGVLAYEVSQHKVTNY